MVTTALSCSIVGSIKCLLFSVVEESDAYARLSLGVVDNKDLFRCLIKRSVRAKAGDDETIVFDFDAQAYCVGERPKQITNISTGLAPSCGVQH
jgi:hypothetical protein